MAFGIAFENGIRYDGRTGGEAHKPRTDRMEKEFKLETAPYSGMAENGMICAIRGLCLPVIPRITGSVWEIRPI